MIYDWWGLDEKKREEIRRFVRKKRNQAAMFVHPWHYEEQDLKGWKGEYGLYKKEFEQFLRTTNVPVFVMVQHATRARSGKGWRSCRNREGMAA